MAIEVSSADASTQQQAAGWFFTVGDILLGIDSAIRTQDGQPRTNGADIGVGAQGSVYVRGQPGQYGAIGAAPAPAPAAFQVSLPMLLVVGLVAYLVLK